MVAIAPIGSLPIAATSSGVVGPPTGTIVQTFDGWSQTAAGWTDAIGSIAQSFDPWSQAAAGVQIVSGTITQTLDPWSQSATGVIAGFLGLTFSSLNNQQLVDWGSETYDSYLHVSYVIPDDFVSYMYAPEIYTFLDTNASLVVDSIGQVVTADDLSSVYVTDACILNTAWNWVDNPASVKFSGDYNVYRYRSDYLIGVAKTHLRGKGRSVQLRFKSQGDDMFNLRGWGIWLNKNTKG